MAPFSECCANVSHPFYNFSIGNIFASASSVSRTMVRCFVSDWNFLTLTSSSPMHTAPFPGELEHVAELLPAAPGDLVPEDFAGHNVGVGEVTVRYLPQVFTPRIPRSASPRSTWTSPASQLRVRQPSSSLR